MTKQEIFKFIEENLNKTVEEIDFRKIAMEYETPKNRKEIKAGLKQKILKVIRNSGVLIFNMDDSNCKYTGKYEPDYKEFYDRGAIHQHIWEPEKLLKKEVWTDYSGTEEIPKDYYTIVVWSKERIDDKKDDPTILNKVEKKLGKNLPLDRLNLLFCINLSENMPAAVNPQKIDEQPKKP